MATLHLTIPRADERRAVAGAACVFIPDVFGVGDEVFGLKTYRTKAQAIRARSRQYRAWARRLAPPVGALCTVELRGEKRHAYLTGQAEVFEEVKPQTLAILRGRMRAFGLSDRDIVARNVGQYQGRWVVLDFDDASQEAATEVPTGAA